MDRDLLVDTILEKNKQIKVSQDERDHYRSKCVGLEGRLHSAKELFRNTGGNLMREMSDTILSLKAKEVDQVVNLDLTRTKYQAATQENMRLSTELSGNINITPIQKRRTGSHLTQSVETHNRHHKERNHYDQKTSQKTSQKTKKRRR